MAYRLVSNLGTWDLAEDETLIGRSRACSICFLDGRLSRRHAAIQVRADAAVVSDCGSTNGVLINGRRITTPTMLHNGDEIIVGPCLFKVECDSAPAPAITTSRRGNQVAQPTTAMYSTEAIELRVEDGSPGRRLSPAIAAAVEPESGSQPGSEGFHPGDFKPHDTEAVVALVKPPPSHDTDILRPSDSVAPAAESLVDAHERAATLPEQPSPVAPSRAPLVRARVLAGLFDGLQTSAASVVVALPVALLGLALALHRAGASVSDGLPRIAFDQPAAGLGSLLLAVSNPSDVAQTYALIPHLKTVDQGVPFLIAILALMLALLLFVLVHLLTTVVATILYGGPYWHRRFGLRIVEQSSGLSPGWYRALARWVLLLVLWPQAAWACGRGRRGLHDRWTGCEVRM